MKCIAIDDEPKALSVIRHYASKSPFLDLTKEFRNSLDALEFLNQNHVDLIFLDINMPDFNGIDFLQSLPTTPMIIFTTAYPEYAVQSYEWDTLGYLLKPIELPKFLKAVNKARTLFELRLEVHPDNSLHISRDFLLVKSGTKTYHLSLDDILYIEASGNYVHFVTKNRKVISANSLGQVLETLPTELFFRIHKSFIIAQQHLEVIETHQVRVSGTILPIGKTYRQAFLKKYKR